MKLRKALLALSLLNVLALVWAACYLPPIVRLYVNVVPFFNFLLTRWLVPVLGLLPTLMLLCMRQYFRAVDRQGGSPKAWRAGVVLYAVLAAALMLLPWFSVWMGHRDISSIQYPLYLGLGMAMAVLYLLMGNYSMVLAPNQDMGLKLSWTLEDPAIWRKTHRLLGKLTFAAAFVMLAAALATYLAQTPLWFYIGLALTILLPVGSATGYAYALHRRRRVS